MSNVFDVVIVGAGPAGLMAAKVAGENGLRVALIERKEHITSIQRSCQTMVAIEDGYYFGERMYFDEQQGRIVFPVNNFSVRYDGPYKNFYAWHIYSPDGKHCINLGDYDANKRGGSKKRLSAFYSKEALLQSLFRDVQACGAVHVFPGLNVTGHCRKNGFNEIRTSEGKVFRGVFTIAADGINSRLMRILDLNRQRRFFGTIQGAGYYMRGVNPPNPESINYPVIYHKTTQYPVMLWVGLSPYGEDEYWVYAGGCSHPQICYKDILDQATRSGPFSDWFKGAEVVRRHGHVANIWSPTPTPVKDNVLIVGDAGWTVEAECTGSMMSGRKAANAVCEALRDGRPNRDGVQAYVDWWQGSFPGSMDYTEFLTLLSSGLIGEDATNYLYKLVNETLPCSLNPYNLLNNINSSIMGKFDRIQQERPDIVARLQQLAAVPVTDQMRPFVQTGFPNT
ncbi:MAG: NAD(P)/FAD-dependent oxidoreductase [Deltaproteobacteria bacterium]|nr:NAD(P)/FAD-dependent oxidoreductase [Deltaproteobacteria bacterium]